MRVSGHSLLKAYVLIMIALWLRQGVMGAQGMPGPQGYSGDEVSEVMIVYIYIRWNVCCQSIEDSVLRHWKWFFLKNYWPIFFKQGAQTNNSSKISTWCTMNDTGWSERPKIHGFYQQWCPLRFNSQFGRLLSAIHSLISSRPSRLS